MTHIGPVTANSGAPSHLPGIGARTMVVLLEVRPLEGTAAYATDARLADAGFTSLDMVKVMLGIEAAFDMMIPQDDITPENFTSAATITAMLERLLAG